MPLPTPKKGEKRSDFMDRCMSNPTAKREFPDNKQRVAVCYRQWREKHPEDKPPEKESPQQEAEVLALSTGSLVAPSGIIHGTSLDATGWLTVDVVELAPGPDDKIGEAGGIRGVVVAEAREFRTPGRGRFNKDSLKRILELWPAEGLKCAAQHPNLLDDGLFNYLGRLLDPWMSRALYTRNGKSRSVAAVRANLAFDPAAAKSPVGDLSGYITERVRNDPDSLATSLVLATEYLEEVDEHGHPLRDKEGELLPPLWMPTELLEADVVAAGDAVTSILSCSEPTQQEPPYEPEKDATAAWWRNRLRKWRGDADPEAS